MDISKLKRDPARCLRATKKMEDGSLMAVEKLLVHIPFRFVDKDLATISENIKTIGAIGFIVDGCYSLFLAQCRFYMWPSEVREVTIDDDKYYELEFEEGDTVIENLTVPIENKTNYYFFIEFNSYGKTPWYMSDENLNKLFDHSGYITEKKVGSTPQVYRIISGIQTRDPDKPEQQYRYSAALKEGRPPLIVGLNNHTMLLKGVFNRLGGGYLADNTVGAILEEDAQLNVNDIILRGIPFKHEENKE